MIIATHLHNCTLRFLHQETLKYTELLMKIIEATARFVTTWDPSLYFPEQVDQKLDEKTVNCSPDRNTRISLIRKKIWCVVMFFSDSMPVYNLSGARQFALNLPD